jgi:hypothetical protein
MNNNDERDYAEERANEELTAEEETAETMAATAEALEDLIVAKLRQSLHDVEFARPPHTVEEIAEFARQRHTWDEAHGI